MKTAEQEFIEKQNKLKEIYEKLKLSLSPEDLKKNEEIYKARKILENAQVPFWLFTERPEINGYTGFARYSWLPKIYDKEGNITNGGRDFLDSHYRRLFYAIDHLLHTCALDFKLEPTQENRLKIFCEQVYKEWKDHTEVYQPEENKA